jgi:hypothetical protein
VETPKRSRWSITDIAESTEISPPEKKRRISETGLVILNALKDVARAHNEELHAVFGNVASQDEQ